MKWLLVIIAVLVIGFFLGVGFISHTQFPKQGSGKTDIHLKTQSTIIFCTINTPCPSGTVCKLEHICPATTPGVPCNTMSLVCEKK